MTTDDKEPGRDEAKDAAATVAADPVDEPGAEPEDAVADGEEAPSGSSGGQLALAGFIVLAFAGLAGYAALPYWRGHVPEPYRSYLPDLPQSETRSLIGSPRSRSCAARSRSSPTRCRPRRLRRGARSPR